MTTYYIAFYANLYIGNDKHIAENIVEIIPLNADNEPEAFVEYLDAIFDGIGVDIEHASSMIVAEENLPTETLALI